MISIQYSQHEGISCDHCMRVNFRGKRYKCLICTDYDLCSSCYESKTVPSGKRHSVNHPVQCILTRNDYEIYYGGESIQYEQPQSFTCPICCKMGFTEALLCEHVSQEHSETFLEVACPICCTIPSTDLSPMTEDFVSHLTIEHRNLRDLDHTQAASRGRRIPHATRNLNSNRSRRQITPASMLTSLNNSTLGSNNQEHSSTSQNSQIDPITELLSRLRRSTTAYQSLNSVSNNYNNNSSNNNLHVENERDTRSNLSIRRFSDRPNDIVIRRHQNLNQFQQNQTQQQNQHDNQNETFLLLLDQKNLKFSSLDTNNTSTGCTLNGQSQSNSTKNSCDNQFRYLLSNCKEKTRTDKEIENLEILKAQKSLFTQELLISLLKNFFPYKINHQTSEQQELLKSEDEESDEQKANKSKLQTFSDSQEETINNSSISIINVDKQK